MQSSKRQSLQKLLISLSISAGLLLGICNAALALAPPLGPETLCTVKGVILSIDQDEASDEQMQPIKAPVISIDITEGHAYNTATANPLCSLSGAQNIYRVCGQSPAMAVGDTIQAVVGRSIGGGRYCIEHIELAH